MPAWSLYLIRTRQNTLYTGITTNVSQRLAQHTQGKQGAKYLRAKAPLTLEYQIELGTRSLASKAEYKIKKLSKSKKERIITESPNRATLLSLLKIEEEETQA